MATSTISNERPVIQSQNVTFQASTTLSYTGVSVTIPAYSVFMLTADCVYNATEPAEVLFAFTDSRTPEPYQTIAHASDGSHLATCGYTHDASMTIYVWARYGSAGPNRCITRLAYRQYA